MVISKYTLKNIQSESLQVPQTSIFELPERVLQFGTGVLLRGLPDYFIDKANRQGIFNGRIVVVKSTDGGDALAFDRQDSLYTICERGIENGKLVEENIVCSSISRVLSAKTEWESVLHCAHNPNMEIIISNTTEVGIELVNDDIRRYPPVSFPGKVLAFLYERFKAFDGSKQCGMVIVPTELISGNGKKLESIVIEQAHLNGLEDAFIDWLENCNTFCNTLVDRIVPGKPTTEMKHTIENQLGYADDLITMTELYRLWAIEGNEQVAERLSFAKVDKGVVIVPDINKYKELKLRILNGTHTLSCGLAFLAGFDTVKSAMDNAVVADFITSLATSEISKAIPFPVSDSETAAFSKDVLDRFRNPSIEHLWLNISMNYTSKLEMRVVPILLQYYKVFNQVPEHIAMGFAAYIYFMKAVKKENDQYWGERNGVLYLIRDEKVAYHYEKWQQLSTAALVTDILQNTSFWGNDLSLLPGFAGTVTEYLEDMLHKGIAESIKISHKKNELV